MASLVVQRPGITDREFELGEETVTVGRQAGCGLVIEDPEVSRRHAEVAPVEGGYSVRDLSSRNGTWLCGQRIGGAFVPLRHGDDIALGRRFVVLRYLTEEETVPEWISPLQNLATHVPGMSTPWEGSERAFRLFRMTPWLRFTSPGPGLVGAILALVWWISRLT